MVFSVCNSSKTSEHYSSFLSSQNVFEVLTMIRETKHRIFLQILVLSHILPKKYVLFSVHLLEKLQKLLVVYVECFQIIITIRKTKHKTSLKISVLFHFLSKNYIFSRWRPSKVACIDHVR